MSEEHSRFPVRCPAKGWQGPTFGCATSGCPHLGYTSVWHYLTCVHPDAVFDDTPTPEFKMPKVWMQEKML